MALRILAVLAFLALPLIEIYALIQVGQVIGAWWTILILVADSVLGAWLLRREWRGTWTALRSALNSGRLPDRELADAALVVVGGTLLLTPGFVTDLAGFLFLLPVTRPVARRLLLSFIARRVQLRASGWLTGRFVTTPGDAPTPPTGSGRPASEPGGGPFRRSGGPVIHGEVVDDDPPRR